MWASGHTRRASRYRTGLMRPRTESLPLTARILKIGEQRPPPEIRRLLPKIQKIAPQRPCNISLSIGNVAHFFIRRAYPTETGVAGWGGRIRTFVWLNQNPLPYRLAALHSAAHHYERHDPKPTPTEMPGTCRPSRTASTTVGETNANLIK